MFRSGKAGRNHRAILGCVRPKLRLSTHRIGGLLFTLLLLAVGAHRGLAYSLLTHEEMVDILWKDDIEPLLLKRFPGAATNELHRAHAYAYGCFLVQDIGYYPFGNKFFSDLTHYVRTGDFVTQLIRDSGNIEEYAFALGALAHYASDCEGHPFVNKAVALAFPELRAKYGASVTFEDSPKAHIQTEFGFDLTQVAKNRYTSDQYHDFIGFEVSRMLLERAFLETYGLRLEAVIPRVDLAIGTFRYAASHTIPQMTRAALTVYHPEIARETLNFSKTQFVYNLSRAQYEKEWGKDYRRPGIFTRALGWALRYVPKIGPLKALAFKIPSSEMEDLYIKSMNLAVQHYRTLLHQAGENSLSLTNMDCDTGKSSSLGEYKLSDATYALLLDELFRRGLGDVPNAMRDNLLAFYDRQPPPQRTRKARKAWHRTASELAALRSGPGSALEAKTRERFFRSAPELFLTTADRVFGYRTAAPAMEAR